ncbi:TPA: hypothetical protein HA351_09390 [Methanosarcinaceae archaeon]|nr:hypothetical protein [Methanosarcinaceae archaeon]
MSSEEQRSLDEIRGIEEGLKAAYTRNTKEAVEAFDRLRDFAIRLIYLNVTAEHELDAKALIVSIGDMGKITAEHRMEIASVAASRALGAIAAEAASQRRDALAIKAVSVLGSLSRELAARGMDTAAKSAAESLGKFGAISARMGVENQVTLSEIYLMQLVREAMEEGLSETGIIAVAFLGEVGAVSVENKLEESAIGGSILLEELGIAAVRENHEPEAKVVINAFEKLGKASSMHGMKSLLFQAAWSVETIRVLAEDKGMNAISRIAKLTLESVKAAGAQDEEQILEKIQDIKKFHRKIMEKS